jgi:hypothetical protein
VVLKARVMPEWRTTNSPDKRASDHLRISDDKPTSHC